MSRVKAFADKHVERFISRKFLAWLTATGLCGYGVVSSSDWVAVTLAYIGTCLLYTSPSPRYRTRCPRPSSA